MRSAATLSFIFFLASCGVEDGVAASPAEVEAKSQAMILVRTPPLPSTPTQLVAASWRSRFIPTTAQSAYVVVVGDPLDRTSFLAWGYDVRGLATLFFFRGTIALDLSRLEAKVAAEVSSIVVGGTAPDFSWGAATQLSGGPRTPPPPPGADWTVWSANAWNSSTALHRVAATFGAN